MIFEGTIVKGIAGFYYVDLGERVIECKARGSFKNNKQKPFVGDAVKIELEEQSASGVITEILKRKNVFQRPPVSNIDLFVAVTALAEPEPNLVVLDKFLTAAEQHGVEVVLCFTKTDRTTPEFINEIRGIYNHVYPMAFLNLTEENAAAELMPYLKGKKSALAGPSGVGKSTLLNLLCGKRQAAAAETGAISEKTKRGKHTTRHVELFSLPFGGYLYDTPGFTSLDAPDVSEEELQELFPEIFAHIGGCRFHGCRHLNEPDCGVRRAVTEGAISEARYQSYCTQMKELQERRKRKYQ